MNFIRRRVLPLGVSPMCQVRRCTAAKHTKAPYSTSLKMADILHSTNAFADIEGRRPRVLLVSMQKERGPTRSADSLASTLAQLGFDVDICPVVEPTAVAREAVESDVHLVHLNVGEEGSVRDDTATVAADVVNDLKKESAEDLPLCLLLPSVEEQKKAKLLACGVSRIFTLDTETTDICEQYIRLLMK